MPAGPRPAKRADRADDGDRARRDRQGGRPERMREPAPGAPGERAGLGEGPARLSTRLSSALTALSPMLPTRRPGPNVNEAARPVQPPIPAVPEPSREEVVERLEAL